MSETMTMQPKEKMLVAQALNEIKILDARIEKAIESMKLCYANKASETRIDGIDKKKVITQIEAAWQSLNDLIARHHGIRRAVNLFNATAKVMIAGVEYTVAEAIAMKNFCEEHERNLLSKMKTQYNLQTSIASKRNIEIETRSDAYMRDNFSAMEKGAIDYEEERQKYIKNNQYELVDPLDLYTLINEKEDYISKFMMQVDTALSVVDATNEIDIYY